MFCVLDCVWCKLALEKHLHNWKSASSNVNNIIYTGSIILLLALMWRVFRLITHWRLEDGSSKGRYVWSLTAVNHQLPLPSFFLFPPSLPLFLLILLPLYIHTHTYKLYIYRYTYTHTHTHILLLFNYFSWFSLIHSSDDPPHALKKAINFAQPLTICCQIPLIRPYSVFIMFSRNFVHFYSINNWAWQVLVTPQWMKWIWFLTSLGSQRDEGECR